MTELEESRISLREITFAIKSVSDKSLAVGSSGSVALGVDENFDAECVFGSAENNYW